MDKIDFITEACRLYGRHNLMIDRYTKAGNPIPYFVKQKYDELTKDMEELWAVSGVNMITACDLTLTEHLMIDINGYTAVAYNPSKNICALKRIGHTVGLFYDIDYTGYMGHYCYHSWDEAIEAINTWDGEGRPPGNWIFHFGPTGEETNENYNKDLTYIS